ncbi:hypothetical protein HN51_005172 [Arachis hypogaea]
MFSLGVFNPKTTQGEQYKEAWAAMYLKDTNLNVKDLFRKICDDNRMKRWLLKSMWQNLYDASTVYADHIIVEACCVLHLLEKSESSVDPEQELKISIDKLVRVH